MQPRRRCRLREPILNGRFCSRSSGRPCGVRAAGSKQCISGKHIHPRNSAAKPIIDILVVLDRHEDGVACVDAMRGLGYKYRGESGVARRHYFRKGSPRTHHVHMFAARPSRSRASSPISRLPSCPPRGRSARLRGSETYVGRSLWFRHLFLFQGKGRILCSNRAIGATRDHRRMSGLALPRPPSPGRSREKRGGEVCARRERGRKRLKLCTFRAFDHDRVTAPRLCRY